MNNTKAKTCSQCGGMAKLNFATIAVFVCEHCKGTGHEPKENNAPKNTVRKV